MCLINYSRQTIQPMANLAVYVTVTRVDWCQHTINEKPLYINRLSWCVHKSSTCLPPYHTINATFVLDINLLRMVLNKEHIWLFASCYNIVVYILRLPIFHSNDVIYIYIYFINNRHHCLMRCLLLMVIQTNILFKFS